MIVTTQVKQEYEGVPDPLGLAPHTQEIRQEAPSKDFREVLKEIYHEKWLKEL